MASSPGHPVLIHFHHAPRAILAGFENLRLRPVEVKRSLRGTGLRIAGLIVGGLAIITLDAAFGYPSHLYIPVGIGLVIVGLWAWRKRHVAVRGGLPDAPDLLAAESVIHTLRDDVAPKRRMHGTIDLRGSVDDAKRSRSRSDARNRTVSYYRDDWFKLKAKLFDGSMLRFVVTKRLKIRDGYYKRGSVSGKRKYKPPKLKSAVSRIDVRVSPNPTLYRLSHLSAPKVGELVGSSVVHSVTLDGGLLRVTATHPREPDADDILAVLSAAYGTLQRKATA